MSIEDIIKAAGGPIAIRDASQKTAHPISHWSVYKWPKNGIPRLQMDLVSKLARVSITKVHAANVALEASRSRPLARRRRSEVRPAA